MGSRRPGVQGQLISRPTRIIREIPCHGFIRWIFFRAAFISIWIISNDENKIFLWVDFQKWGIRFQKWGIRPSCHTLATPLVSRLTCFGINYTVFSELHSSLLESCCVCVCVSIRGWVGGQESKLFSTAFVVWHCKSALKHFIENSLLPDFDKMHRAFGV